MRERRLSFVPERLNRIKVCGFPCWINAKNKTDSSSRTEPEGHPERGHVGRQRRPQNWNHPDHNRSDQDADQTADSSEHDGLQGELQENIAFACADSLAHANFTSALGHAD